MSWDTLPEKYQATEPTAASVRSSQRGLQNRRAGEYFENMISASLRWYEDRGVACVEKTPEPMKPLGKPNKQGQFKACYTKAGQPDFKGTLVGGLSVVFEAKHTGTDRIEYNRLTDEQIEKLDKHYTLGAAAFVLVSFGLQDFYRIPWEVWENMKAIYGRKYIKQTELEPYRVQYIAGVIKLLEGAELFYKDEAMLLIEKVLDTLVEVGNGVTNEHLHEAADQLFRARDLLVGEEKELQAKLKERYPDSCVVCGAYAGEGRQICLKCQQEVVKNT